MPSSEIKRNFQRGKMNKDLDDRLVPPGEFRDALNVNIGRSEGDDVGALQVVRGNRLAAQTTQNPPDDQDPNWITRPFGETIGVYPYPQEEKIYFFNTGRHSEDKETCTVPNDSCIDGFQYRELGEPYGDTCNPVDTAVPRIICEIAFVHPRQNAIYEYDQTTDIVAPVLIETDEGDYEAGGNATQEFIAELPKTQIHSVENLQYLKEISPQTEDRVILSVPCSQADVIDRDANDDPIYHIDGKYCETTCTDPSQDDCDVAQLIFYAADNSYICTTDGTKTGDVCTCDDDGCNYVRLECNDSDFNSGLTRQETDCSTTAGQIPDSLNYEYASELVLLDEGQQEVNTAGWSYVGDPTLTIQEQTISNSDIESSTCDPTDFSYVGQTKYTLNGNGNAFNPDQYCDPSCPEIVDPACVPTPNNNMCYPDYCAPAPILDANFDTQLTSAAITANRNRILTITGVENVDSIEVTLARLRPTNTDVTYTFDPDNVTYTPQPLENNGRGVFESENSIEIRGMDALDFAQLDQIFGRVGLGSREVGYSYRVVYPGQVSWIPQVDDTFFADPDPNTDTQAVLSSIDPADPSIPPAGEDGGNLEFDVNVDRQQTYFIDADDKEVDIDDNTEL